MSVHIQLDGPRPIYTNLEFITGRVILSLQSSASFSAIVVKLEGESRSRLQGVRGSKNESQPPKQTTEMEYHRLLYKTQTVFPTPELQKVGTGSSFTLPPGQYEYPFKLKFPFNNMCSANNAPMSNIGFGGIKLEVVRDTNRHVKQTLPPSLGGFPGLAEIKYFIKVTAVKPKFYQENVRAFQNFIFNPIEPPRPENTRGEETFARRSHKFAPSPRLIPKKFSIRKSSTVNLRQDVHTEPPAFTVDARLPNPAILTCNDTLPLRILVKKTNQSPSILFLSTLSIELFAFTNIRAHDLSRTEKGSWILTSQSNMQVPLGSSGESSEKELKVPKRFYDQLRLPATVCPSFDTCNITRSYELEVRVGLSHGQVGNIQPELLVMPLRFPVEVYSGIAPPESLLAAMRNPVSAPAPKRPTLTVPTPSSSSSSYPVEPSPMASPYPAVEYPPAQSGTFSNPEQPPYDDAPPTYEEALAEDIAPTDGPRFNYIPPPSPAPPMPPRPNQSGSEKGSSVHRMPSERLFPNSTGSTSSQRDSLAQDDGEETDRPQVQGHRFSVSSLRGDRKKS